MTTKWDDVPPVHYRAVCPHCGRATDYDDPEGDTDSVECDECGKLFNPRNADYIDVFELEMTHDEIVKRMIAWTRTPADQRPAWSMTADEARLWQDYWRYCGRFMDGSHDRGA